MDETSHFLRKEKYLVDEADLSVVPRRIWKLGCREIGILVLLVLSFGILVIYNRFFPLDGSASWDSPYNTTCSAYTDNAEFFTADTCGGFDTHLCDKVPNSLHCVDGIKGLDESGASGECFSTMQAANGTALAHWCDTACDEGWGAYCIWTVFDQLESACAGTLKKSDIYAPPGRRRASGLGDEVTADATRLPVKQVKKGGGLESSEGGGGQGSSLRVLRSDDTSDNDDDGRVLVNAYTCDIYARCSACSSSEDVCTKVFHTYYHYHSGGVYYAAAAIASETVLEEWCYHFGFSWGASHLYHD